MEKVSKNTIIMFALVTVLSALGNLSQTAVNSMLLGIQQTFGIVESISQWLTTAYMLVIGITIPLVVHLSKKISTKDLITISSGFLLLGALTSWIAPSFLVLLAGRVLQAVSTGITLPLITTISMTRFPPGKNATAMGIAGIALGFAPNIGPLIGGSLVNSFGWRSFFIVLAICVLCILLFTLFGIKHEMRHEFDGKIDYLSFLLSTFGFGGLLLGFSNAAILGFGNVSVLAEIAIGAVCLVIFVVRQKRISNPLITMRIFCARSYRISFIAQNCLFASFMGITLIIPLFVQNICGLSALDAGMVFIPATIVALFCNPISGLLADKVGTRPVIIIASTMLFAGSLWMSFVDTDTPLWMLMLMQGIRGAGVSSLIGPIISWGMKDLQVEDMMDGSAFFATVRQACASFGTAIMMFVVTMGSAVFASSMGFGGEVLSYQLAFGFSTLCAAVVLLLAIFKVD